MTWVSTKERILRLGFHAVCTGHNPGDRYAVCTLARWDKSQRRELAEPGISTWSEDRDGKMTSSGMYVVALTSSLTGPPERLSAD
jgi:hypothetical protein